MKFKILLLGLFGILSLLLLSSLTSAILVNQTSGAVLDSITGTAPANTLVGWRIEPLSSMNIFNVYKNTTTGVITADVVRIRDETNTVIGEANFTGLKADFGAGVSLISGGNYSIVMTNRTATWVPVRSVGALQDFPAVFGDFNITATIDNSGLEAVSNVDWWGIERVEYELTGNTVVLNSPIADASILRGTINFNSSVTSINTTLTNATLYIWDSVGDLLGNQVNTITGVDITNETIFINSTLDFGNYSWNVLGCGNNDTGSASCVFASSNFSFDILGFTVDSQVFSAEAFETDSEIFELNITVIEGILSVSSRLNYNTSISIATITNTTNTSYTLTSTIDIPLVVGSDENQNKSFFWEVTTFDGTTSAQSNTTQEFQNVTRIHLEVCDATFDVRALNFSAFDEQTSNRIDPFYMAAEFNFWLGGGAVRRPLAFSNLSSNELGLCITPSDRNITIDDTVEYNDVINSSTYNTRNYYFQNSIINNITQHIPLFLLNVDDSTSFILKVQDTNLLPISGALIDIQRLDVGTGNFTTVQIAKTDDNGQTIGFFKTETVDYRFIITRNGLTLLETGSQKVIPDTAPFTLTFTVGEDAGAPWIRFEDLDDLTETLVFNSSTAIVTYTYIDTSGIFSSSRLLVLLQNQSGFATTICDINSTLSSGILSCNTGNVSGTYTASGFITRGADIFLVEQIIFLISTFSDVAGLLGVFLAWFIILISAFTFKFNEIAAIVLMNLAVIFVNMIGLVNFGFLFIFGMMGVSILIIVLLNR